MDTSQDQIRQLYAELIMTLTNAGRTDEALACSRLAVRQKLWRDAGQRPVHYATFLRPQPVYDPRRFWVARYLEEHYAVIRAEIDRVIDPLEQGFSPAAIFAVKAGLLNEGKWNEAVFYEDGHRVDRTASFFPETAAIVDALPSDVLSAGVVQFSWLNPGAHLVPHCGTTNTRLRVHLGVRTPGGASIRVKDRILTWQEGRCLVFDDSFEHEVWHRGSEPRVVLIVDIFHPELPDAAKQDILTSRPLTQSQVERIRHFMERRGLHRIIRAVDESIATELDEPTMTLLRRVMRDAQLRSITRSPTGTISAERDSATSRPESPPAETNPIGFATV